MGRLDSKHMSQDEFKLQTAEKRRRQQALRRALDKLNPTEKNTKPLKKKKKAAKKKAQTNLPPENLEELGRLMGIAVAEKIRSYSRQDDAIRKQKKQMNFEEEYAKNSRVLVKSVMTDRIVSALEKELNAESARRNRSGKQYGPKRLSMFDGLLHYDMMVNGAEDHGPTSLRENGCPILGSFLISLKREMGWQERKFADVSYLRTPDSARGRACEGVHLDVEHLKKANMVDPICLYFSTRNNKDDPGVFLRFQETQKNGPGRPPLPKKLVVPKKAILFFNPQRILHGTWPWEDGSPKPPRRVNIMIYQHEELVSAQFDKKVEI